MQINILFYSEKKHFVLFWALYIYYIIIKYYEFRIMHNVRQDGCTTVDSLDIALEEKSKKTVAVRHLFYKVIVNFYY